MAKKTNRELPIPMEIIKDFEQSLRQKGLIAERQYISHLQLGDVFSISPDKNNIIANTLEENERPCTKWKNVPTRVWDPQLGAWVTVIERVCVQRG